MLHVEYIPDYDYSRFAARRQSCYYREQQAERPRSDSLLGVGFERKFEANVRPTRPNTSFLLLTGTVVGYKTRLAGQSFRAS